MKSLELANEVGGVDQNFEKVFLLKSYGNMLRKNEARRKEGERLVAEGYELLHKLPSWSDKLIYCLVE
jgi:hypothetical protein